MKTAIGLDWAKQVKEQHYGDSLESAGTTTYSRHWNGKRWVTMAHNIGKGTCKASNHIDVFMNRFKKDDRRSK